MPRKQPLQRRKRAAPPAKVAAVRQQGQGRSGRGGEHLAGGTANPAGCLGWILVVSANLLRPGLAAWQAAWEQIKQTALAVWEPVRAAALDLWNGALQPLADYLLTVFLPGVANSFSQAFAPILGGTISAAMTILGNLFVWLCGLIGELVNTVVQPALALLLEIWQGVMDGITAAWQAYGQPILDGLVQAFQGLTDLLTALWQSVLRPF